MKIRHSLALMIVLTLFISNQLNTTYSQAGPLGWALKLLKKNTKKIPDRTPPAPKPKPSTPKAINPTIPQAVGAGAVAALTTHQVSNLLDYYELHQYDEDEELTITKEINVALNDKKTYYTTRICISKEGKKIAVPSTFQVCPEDSSIPKEGPVIRIQE